MSLLNLKNKKTLQKSQLFINIALFLLMIMSLAPLYFLIIKSFKTANQDVLTPFSITFPFEFENYKIAWLVVKDFLLNTLIIALFQTIGVLVVCSTAI